MCREWYRSAGLAASGKSVRSQTKCPSWAGARPAGAPFARARTGSRRVHENTSRLRIRCLDFGDELGAARVQLLFCRAHIRHLKGQNRAGVEWIKTALRAKDLEQLPRRHLKLNHSLAFYLHEQPRGPAHRQRSAQLMAGRLFAHPPRCSRLPASRPPFSSSVRAASAPFEMLPTPPIAAEPAGRHPGWLALHFRGGQDPANNSHRFESPESFRPGRQAAGET